MIKTLILGLLISIVAVSTSKLNAESKDLLPGAQNQHKKGSVKGRVIQSGSGVPITYASISCNDRKTFAKSSSNGDFILYSIDFPVRLRICKFGFKDEYLTLYSPEDSALIMLSPVVIHKGFLGISKPLNYESLFKRSLEKLRMANNQSQREIIYCRITLSVDSTLQSLFESYAHMNVGGTFFSEYEPEVSRYAAPSKSVPGLSENILEFKTQAYLTLPMFVEKHITNTGFYEVNGNQVAMVSINLQQSEYSFYINVADTSITYVSGTFNAVKKKNIPGTELNMRDYKNYFSISFSNNSYGEGACIDYVSRYEEFTVINKEKSIQHISKQTVFSVIPDSSAIIQNVKNSVLHQSLSTARQQISLNPNFTNETQRSAFASETEKLFSKAYDADFWIDNSFITFQNEECKQIRKWEENNMFYSDEYQQVTASCLNPDSLINRLNNSIVAVENVYVETDRNSYTPGDTIWFSTFVLDNLHLDSTTLSRILYVDLIDSENKLKNHLKLFIRNGKSEGDFTLARDSKEGVYRVRAYTQYMRNYQGDYLFEKPVTVRLYDKDKIITVFPVINKTFSGDSVDLYIRTTIPPEYSNQEKRLEVRARLNDSITFRKVFTFGNNLKDHMGFFVPSDISCTGIDIKLSLALSGNNILSEERLSIPLKPTVNLQFFPESGKMIYGINSFIAFKATDNSGNPAEFSADIIDENDSIVTQIWGDMSGIGKFSLTPESSHLYKARLDISGTKYYYELPRSEPEGYILNFDPASSNLLIKNNINRFKANYFLLFSVRGAIHASVKALLDSNTVKVHVPLNLYPKGIIQVTLFDSLFRPLAERLIFNNRLDQKLLINIGTDKNTFAPREKINLKLHVTDARGDPVISSLSIAVTDSSNNNSLPSSPDIESYLYFASELKGQTDSRLMNLADTSAQGIYVRDLVMMTQGWRNYLWNSIRYKKTIDLLYPIEKGFFITGKVNGFDSRKSVPIYNLNYVDFKSGFNGITKAYGNKSFRIEIPFHYNSHSYFIQSRNIKDKIEKVNIAIDTFLLPDITFKNNDLLYLPYITGDIKAFEKQNDSTNAYNLKFIKLPEVKVTARSDRSGYTSPEISLNLDKKDPLGIKYSNIFQMIYEEFGEAAFKAKGYDTKGKIYNPILVVNGNPTTSEYCPPCYDWLSYSSASDIPVNEISDVRFYEAGSSFSQWLTPHPEPVLITSSGASTVKWKTDATGNGLYMLPPDPALLLPVVAFKTYQDSYRGNPRGAIIFPFQGLYEAREFYQPDYENFNFTTPDNRKTIYWNPDLQTDSTGTANVTFYNSDLKGRALIRVVGISYTLKDASSAQSGYFSH